MSLKRMDNVGIVVEDIDAAIDFFTELGPRTRGAVPLLQFRHSRGGGNPPRAP